MVNFIQRLFEFLRKLFVSEPVKSERFRKDNSEVEKILNRDLNWDSRCFKPLDTKNYGIYLADKDYYAVDMVTTRRWCKEINNSIILKLREILKKIGVTWLAEIFDCDNWALRFKSNFDLKFLEAFPEERIGAFCGEVWFWYKENNVIKYGHAVNFVFDVETQEIRLVEPQTGKFIDITKNYHCYLAKL